MRGRPYKCAAFVSDQHRQKVISEWSRNCNNTIFIAICFMASTHEVYLLVECSVGQHERSFWSNAWLVRKWIQILSSAETPGGSKTVRTFDLEGSRGVTRNSTLLRLLHTPRIRKPKLAVRPFQVNAGQAVEMLCIRFRPISSEGTLCVETNLLRVLLFYCF